jgi:hypothetical protein
MASFAFVLVLLIKPGFAFAPHPEVRAEFDRPQRHGEARYTVLAWPVFDAELWSEASAFSWDRPFALSLTYRRDIEADALLSRSISGMAGRSRLDAPEQLTGLLRTCFADVRAGDRFTGVSLDANRARFYLNGRQTCEMSWPGFRRAFFGIWLDGRGGNRGFSARLTRGASTAWQ